MALAFVGHLGEQLASFPFRPQPDLRREFHKLGVSLLAYLRSIGRASQRRSPAASSSPKARSLQTPQKPFWRRIRAKEVVGAMDALAAFEALGVGERFGYAGQHRGSISCRANVSAA